MDNKYFDNTMLTAYKKCPRSYFLRHVMGWRGQGISLPLTFGLSWHSAMDVVWQFAKKVPKDELPRLALAKFLETWEEQGLSPDMSLENLEQWGARNPSVAHEMLVQYVDQRWTILQGCELLANEQPFAVPIPGLDNIWYIGRLDKVPVIQGQPRVVEHKTTAIYRTDGGFDYSYIEGWFSDSQVKGYQFAGGQYFPGLTDVWVDCALVHKKVHDKFRFVPVAHQGPLLQEWLDDTKEWIARIEADLHRFTAMGGHIAQGVFPKNEGSCYDKYGSCSFLPICRTTADPSALTAPPEGYIEERWEPFELLGLDKIINKQETSNG